MDEVVTASAKTQTPSLRERKRARVRQNIVSVGTDLFGTRGYDQTTIAQIAEAADIGTRTFFSYFASKEELLFPESDLRVQAALDAIEARTPSDRPADVLLAALRATSETSDEMFSGLAALRLRLAETVPAVRARSSQVQHDAERTIAQRLHEAFPGQLSELDAVALVGAFIGSVAAVLGHRFEAMANGKTPAPATTELAAELHAAVAKSLTGGASDVGSAAGS